MCLFGSQVSPFLMAESLLTSPGQLQSHKLITRHFEKINLAAVAPNSSYLLWSVCLLGEKETFLTEIPLLVSFPQKGKLFIRSLGNAGPLQSCETEFMGEEN